MNHRAIIGEILAAWEDAANTAAVESHCAAEDDANSLLRSGVEVPVGSTQEQHHEALAQAWQAVEDGRELAKAWYRIRAGLRRILRTLRVKTLEQRRAEEASAPAKPWELRHAHEATIRDALVAPQHVEHATVVLDKDKLEAEARTHGLWKEESNEPQT